MDVYCPVCGEPWEHDSLHEEAQERYGIPYYLEGSWGEPRVKNPAYDGDAYQAIFKQVSAEFRSKGCAALFGSRCSTPSKETDRTFGLTRQAASAALYDLLGDDMDGAASMLEDLGF